MRHIIFVRFGFRGTPNRRLPDAPARGIGGHYERKGFDMSDTRELFDYWKMLLQSHLMRALQAQTNQKFIVQLLYTDPTPLAWLKSLDLPYHWALVKITDDIRTETVRPGSICSRLDADDIICDDYVERTQRILEGAKQDSILNWYNGFYYCNGQYYKISHRSSPFISILSHNRSVFWHQHYNMWNQFPVKWSCDRRGYISVRHKDNASEDRADYMRVPAPRLPLNVFSVLPDDDVIEGRGKLKRVRV